MIKAFFHNMARAPYANQVLIDRAVEPQSKNRRGTIRYHITNN